jgi:hypothetical protein
MTKLLVQGGTILAADDQMLVTDQFVRTYTPEGKADAEYPLHVIEGWQVVDAVLPEDFTCAGYTWAPSGLVPKVIPVPLPPVPEEVEMYQARAALIASGKMAAVKTALAGLAGIEGELIREYFEFSPKMQRRHRYVLAMQPVLQLTDAEMDDLFRLAATF